MVDGLPGLTGRYGSPPTIGVERVELVKGPMSVLYGQIQPGGFLNLITKKPQLQDAFEVGEQHLDLLPLAT
jgi:iron complex outermembrane receptor protein